MDYKKKKERNIQIPWITNKRKRNERNNIIRTNSTEEPNDPRNRNIITKLEYKKLQIP